jgi:hypothetical protein
VWQFFVFGETKRPAEADLFVVPHLAMRLKSGIKLHSIRSDSRRFLAKSTLLECGEALPFFGNHASKKSHAVEPRKNEELSSAAEP